MEAASLDFFEKMTEQELLLQIDKPVAESSWFNSLFGNVYSGKEQYIQLEELHIPTGGIHELPTEDVPLLSADDQFLADYDQEMLEKFETQLTANEDAFGDLTSLAWDSPAVQPPEAGVEMVEYGDFDALEAAGIRELAEEERNALAAEFNQTSGAMNYDDILDAPGYEADLVAREAQLAEEMDGVVLERVPLSAANEIALEVEEVANAASEGTFASLASVGATMAVMVLPFLGLYLINLGKSKEREWKRAHPKLADDGEYMGRRGYILMGNVYFPMFVDIQNADSDLEVVYYDMTNFPRYKTVPKELIDDQIFFLHPTTKWVQNSEKYTPIIQKIWAKGQYDAIKKTRDDLLQQFDDSDYAKRAQWYIKYHGGNVNREIKDFNRAKRSNQVAVMKAYYMSVKKFVNLYRLPFYPLYQPGTLVLVDGANGVITDSMTQPKFPLESDSAWEKKEKKDTYTVLMQDGQKVEKHAWEFKVTHDAPIVAEGPARPQRSVDSRRDCARDGVRPVLAPGGYALQQTAD